MCVKPDESRNSKRAKSRIVIFGNQELCSWSKSDCYTPVMKQQDLRFSVSNAVANKRMLKQDDCKNAFCHSSLLEDEAYIVTQQVDCPHTPNVAIRS